ncbi:MAG TPA: lamin tail domain-containing protein [Ktedonobacterales bacterium]|nr:lamin tail domain-containing protein [Ktedonobacterales bacterium]
MEDFSASSRLSSQLSGQRSTKPQSTLHLVTQRAITRLFCGIAAALLLLFLSCALFLFWMPTPASTALAATGCPTSNLPPTPTAGVPLDPGSIKLSEILTNPQTHWNCNNPTNVSADQWIELKNLSSSDMSLVGLQLGSGGAIVALNSTFRIAANGFLVIFDNQFPSIHLSSSFGMIELLDSQGNAIDTVNYPPLGPDQSYIRDSSGQWSISDTPTPGAPNVNGSSPTPTATPTKHSSGSSGGGGSSGAPTATPTPISSVFIPTDTPDLALHSPGNDSASSGNNDNFPSWLKITLLLVLGGGLLAVVVWYIRSWGKESESDT